MEILSSRKSVVLLLCGAFLFVWGCSSDTGQKNAGGGHAQMMPAPTVNTFKIAKGDQKLHFEYPARVRSVGAVEVYSKVSGTLLEQFYKEGEFVQKDTPLFKIDPSKYQAVYDEALAALGVKHATLNQAEREWQRASTLFEQKALSQKEKDDAFAAYETARASVANAEATLQRAQLDLDYTTIVAPVSGMSGVKTQDIGAFVGGTSATVTTITQTAPIYVEFAIADSQAIEAMTGIKTGKMNQKGALSVSVLDRKGNLLDKGEIDFIDSRIDESIGSIKVRAIVPNEAHALLPGQFVRIAIDGITLPNSAAIPQQAVLQTAQGIFVYILKDGKAQIVPVNIEQSVGKDFIITGLFEDGDELIVNNLMKIHPDSPVNVDVGSGGK